MLARTKNSDADKKHTLDQKMPTNNAVLHIVQTFIRVQKHDSCCFLVGSNSTSCFG